MHMAMLSAREEALALRFLQWGSYRGSTLDLRTKELGGPLTQEATDEIGFCLYGLAELHQLYYKRVAGVQHTGTVIATAFSEVVHATGKRAPMVHFNWEVAQDRLEVRGVYSKFCKGDRVLLLDSAIISHHTSKVTALRALTEAGLIVTDLVVLIDLEQGDLAGLYSEFPGLNVYSIFSMSQLLSIYLCRSKITQSAHDEAVSHLVRRM